MKHTPVIRTTALWLLALLMLMGSVSGAAAQELYGQTYTDYAWMPATLNQRLATRTGPGTQYDEPGSFFSAGTVVTVLSKAYDDPNGIWWVQVEFASGGSLYRAYTGIKRFRDLSLQYIPEERVIGQCWFGHAVECYYGPSYDYKRIKRDIPAGTSCDVIAIDPGYASDFIQVEFYDAGLGQYRRPWVAEWQADELYRYDW